MPSRWSHRSPWRGAATTQAPSPRGLEPGHAHHLPRVSYLCADTHRDLMSVREAVAAGALATNAAVAAAATAAAAEAAAASKAAAAHEVTAKAAAAANERRALGVRTPSNKPDLPKEPGGGAGIIHGADFSGGRCSEWGPGSASSR